MQNTKFTCDCIIQLRILKAICQIICKYWLNLREWVDLNMISKLYVCI